MSKQINMMRALWNQSFALFILSLPLPQPFTHYLQDLLLHSFALFINNN